MRNVILHNPPAQIRPMPPREVTEHTWTHAYHDEKRINRVFWVAAGLGALAFLSSGAAIGMNHGNPQQAVSNWILFTQAPIAAGIGYTIFEIRNKLDYLRRNFNAAAGTFNEIEKKLADSFRNTILAARPGITDYLLNIRKYPIQTLVAWGTVALTIATRQPSLAALGAAVWSNMVLWEEQHFTEELSNESYKAFSRLKFAKNNPGAYEIIEKGGKLDAAIELGVIDTLAKEDQKTDGPKP